MSDPTRILDQAGTDPDAVLKRALLRAARGRAPSPGARRELLLALGADARASERKPSVAPGPLFASVLARGSLSRGRFWPGAIVAAAHAALFALVIHGAQRPVSEPRTDPEVKLVMQARAPLPQGEGRGEAPPGRQPEAKGAPAAKGNRPPALTAARDRTGDPAVEAAPVPADDAVPPPRREPGAEAVSDERAAAFATAAAGSDVLPFGEGMSPPRLLEGPDPVVPREAREARVEGTMLVKCVITTAGALQGCRVLKSLPFLEEPVLEALARRRYTPVLFQGRPVNVEYVIPLRFELP